MSFDYVVQFDLANLCMFLLLWYKFACIEQACMRKAEPRSGASE